jgi:NADPH-dependent glutamate synthase beta subunit-like oxidoreductase
MKNPLLNLKSHSPNRSINFIFRMFKIAVIGAGPAGVSATLRLLKYSKGPKIAVNLFDRSLLPFGLVRTGVAPDHPEVKHTTQAWDSIGDYK